VNDATTPTLIETGPATESFRDDVLHGLRQAQKTLPSKYLYDRRGSLLFDQICELDEYYPTRTELAITQKHAAEIAAMLGPNCLLIEYGSGSSLKTRLLLDHLEDAAGYVPVDISREHLLAAAKSLSKSYPDLEIIPVCADFTGPFEIPDPRRPAARRVIYFPGSTIGNFTRRQAAELLANMAETAAPAAAVSNQCDSLATRSGGVLIGVDLKKDATTLERAYNDSPGVTAAFNLNVLHRINRQLDADFAIDAFEHEARYEPRLGRMEMHLVSRKDQSVEIGGEMIQFERGETIHTENSHKYSLDDFREMASKAGLKVEKIWLDDQKLFSVQYLSRAC